MCAGAHARGSDFNPRSPHGERLVLLVLMVLYLLFQPTLPTRGATPLPLAVLVCQIFQPTLPTRGATHSATCTQLKKYHFNPRSQHGERLYC